MDSKLCAYLDSRRSHTALMFNDFDRKEERGLGTVKLKHGRVKSQIMPRDIWKETKNGFCLNHGKAFTTWHRDAAGCEIGISSQLLSLW